MRLILLTLLLSTLLFSAELISETETEEDRVCVYDDGTSIIIPWGDYCPYYVD